MPQGKCDCSDRVFWSECTSLVVPDPTTLKKGLGETQYKKKCGATEMWVAKKSMILLTAGVL